MNHDVAAILAFAGRWLEGEGLYTDLLDINPPLIFVLNLAPAAIGAWTPVGAIPAFQLLVLGLCALSSGLALRLRPAGAGAMPVLAASLVAALPLLALAGGYEFGQREHLMAVMALPYLLHAGRRCAGEAASVPRGLAIAVALLAALGFALKPHFLAIPALVEALVLVRRGRRAALRDPVPWAMAAMWLCYLAAIPLAFPAYAERVLPLIRAHYLDLGDVAWWQVAVGERLGSTLIVLLPLGALAFRRGAAPLAQVLALAAFGASLAAIVQHKGWDYHLLPARILTGLLGVTLAAQWLDAALPAARGRAAAPGLAAVGAWALAAFLVTGAAAPWRELRWPTSDGAALTAAVTRAAGGKDVLVLSPYIDPVFQALAYAGARFTLPSMTIWPLQGAYGGDHGCPADIAGGAARYRAPAAMPAEEAALFEAVAEEFAEDPPAALLVALNPRIGNCGRGFDLIGYFARHPLFAATLRRYRAGPVVAGHRLYTRIE